MLEKEYIEVGENTSKHIINKVYKGSIAEELGIEVGYKFGINAYAYPKERRRSMGT